MAAGYIGKKGKELCFMAHLISILIVIAVFSVAGILLAGLLNMTRRGSVSLSQKLMRWRVGVQLIALCFIMASLYLSGV